MLKQRDAMDPSQPGKGNWAWFQDGLGQMEASAAEWKQTLAGIARPWLCWKVSDRWCMLQQRLVQQVGWTPVIGYDPRTGPPTVLPGSVLINFNEHFGYDIMLPHFAMEFAHLFTERLAFWHSDLLCRLEVMRKLSEVFEALPDGAVAAVRDIGGRRNLLRFHRHRYWELVGCTTRGASQSQFDYGAGWWRYIDAHPNCPDPRERRRRERYYYDHGVGIMYWKRHYRGKVVNVPEQMVAEGHCTSINRSNYRRVAPSGLQDLGTEIDMNFDIEEVAKKLGIEHLL